ncbi:MAG: aminoglycoside phosphotransferase family protein [Candidatus Zixiibacteriota bacterium]
MKPSAEYTGLLSVTDPSEMGERISTLLPELGLATDPEWSLSVPRVLPRKSGEVLIQYRISTPPSAARALAPTILFGVFHPEHRPFDTPTPETCSGIVAIRDLRLHLWKFPSDPELHHLPTLLDGERFVETYGESLEAHSLPSTKPEQPLETYGYRLGRRFVGRLRWDAATPKFPNQTKEVLVKMCRPRQALALWTRQRQLENVGFHAKSEDSISLPHQYFVHGETGALFQTFETGVALHELTSDEQFITGCEAAARILEKLQRVKLTGLPRHSPHDEIEHLRWMCNATAAAFPESETDIRRHLGELLRRLPSTPAIGKTIICHRDFYDKQVLFDGTRSILVDYDTLSEGDASLDYGNFAAHLQWRAMQTPKAAGIIEAGLEAFDRRRRHANPELTQRVEWWIAAALLRIACLYLWRPRWSELASELLSNSNSRACVTT